MRIFAISDIHIDYAENARWVANLSGSDYQNDMLILAGDITDSLERLEWSIKTLVKNFKKIMFVPGNHDLWITSDDAIKNSLTKFNEVCRIVEDTGASMKAYQMDELSIIPLLGWYDYSFGKPGKSLLAHWRDYRYCFWPDGFDEKRITDYFTGLNNNQPRIAKGTTITFSHFLPRIDLMPERYPDKYKILYPVFGTIKLEQQLRKLKSDIHVYGHSHLNRNIRLDNTLYINNAFGYPKEISITSKQLKCIYDTD